MRKALITIALSILCIGMARAQVTIGSDETPLEGTLLYLKQTGVTNKGLGLPRVELTNLKTLSMGDLVIVNALTHGGTSTVWKDHMGLVVYNMKPLVFDLATCKNKGVSIGVHVWTGEKWEEIAEQPEGGVGPGTGYEADVRTLKYDGQKMQLSYKEETTTYSYANFGEAGIWMTENLNTQYSPNGTKLENKVEKADVGRGKYNFAYPSSTSPTSDIDYKANYDVVPQKPVGLLYDWYTATNSENCIDHDQGQVGSVAVAGAMPSIQEVEAAEETRRGAMNGKIKGICPTGWHLPSDREWSELFYALHNDPDAYSTGSGYSTTWAVDPKGAVTLGGVLKSKIKVENIKSAPSRAFSKSADSGGFDVLLVGIALYAESRFYGSYSYFFSSGGSSHDFVARVRSVSTSDQKIVREDNIRDMFLPIRCKKDQIIR